MMNINFRISGIILAIALFCSCSKSNETAPYPITGNWIGTLTVDGQPEVGSLYFSFDIHSDSTIHTVSKGPDASTNDNEATWTLTGTTFKATVIATSASNLGVIQDITATYSGSKGTLTSGIWKNRDTNLFGTFKLERQN